MTVDDDLGALVGMLRSGAVRGVRVWAGAPPAPAVEAAAADAGWRCATVNTMDRPTKDGLLARTGEALEFGSYYGRNFDAMEECLGDVEVGAGLLVQWRGWEAFAVAQPEQFATAVDIFRSAVKGWRSGGGRAAVVLASDGPIDDTAAAAVTEVRRLRLRSRVVLGVTRPRWRP